MSHSLQTRSFCEAFARHTLRWRYVILGCWAVLVSTLVLTGLPRFGDEGMSLQDLAPVDAPEVVTELDSVRIFRVPLNARTQVVRRNPEGLSAQVQRGDFQAAIALSRRANRQPKGAETLVLALPISNLLGVFPSSDEDATTTIVNLVGFPTASIGARNRAAHDFAVAARKRADGPVRVTGGIPAQVETGWLIREAIGKLQVAAIIALVAIVALWFRSLVAPLVVLASIASTLVLLLEVLGLAQAWFGITVPSEAMPVVTAVAIGVSTDYTLFLLRAWQRNARDGVVDATHRAIASTMPTVAAAGATTALAVSALWLAEMGFVRAFAPSLLIAAGVSVLVALGLVPALIGALGRWVLWPRRPWKRLPRDNPWWTRLVRNPRIALVTCVGVLAVVVTGASFMKLAPVGFNIISGLPDDTEVARGAHDASQGFAPGILSPTLLLIEGKNLDTRLVELRKASRQIDGIEGVAGVLGPDILRASIERAGLGDEVARLENELAGLDGEDPPPTDPSVEQPRPADAVLQASNSGVLVTRDGRHARMVVVLEADAYSGSAVRMLNRARPAFTDALHAAGIEGATVRIAGDTALVARVVGTLNHDLWIIVALLVPIQMLMVFAFLRSAIISVVVVATSLLSVAAAIGITGMVDHLWGPGEGLVFFVPVAAFVLLMSVGADYGVLMGSALRDAHASGLRGSEQAIAAMRSSSATVVLAGCVLLASFAMLAVVPLESFRQFAVVMCSGVAVDTLVMRPVVMPLLVTWLGRLPERNATRMT